MRALGAGAACRVVASTIVVCACMATLTIYKLDSPDLVH